MVSKKILPLLFLFLLSLNAQAQADLTLTSISNTPSSADLGDLITVNYNITNVGSGTAMSCFVSFYVSSTPTFNNAIYLSRVSLETLAAGAASSNNAFVYPIPHNTPPGQKYLLISIDSENQVNESNENNNNFYSNNQVNVTSFTSTIDKLPYPMIFIHGLVGDNSTWDLLLGTFQSYYGWTYGGNMKFCLNQDGNTGSSNQNADYQDWTNSSLLTQGDFFTVNFNVDQNGNNFFSTSNNFESNQAAVAKQGLAIRDAISHVLNKTGKDKVILVGHSMGGLAAREYLQNTGIWQPDGQHHVAKISTIGTPHGGSNATSFGTGMAGVNELSEAVRDLRYSYFSGYNGVYLFGGNEDPANVTGSILNFCNVDINCNGQIYNNITGLNQKSIPGNIDYSCIIGTGSLLGGDGVVSEVRANINTYYAMNADTFISQQPSFIPGGTWHTELNKQIPVNVQGIDEPDDLNNAYNLSPNRTFFANLSEPSLGSVVVNDFDCYKFNVTGNGNLNIKVYDIPIAQFAINVLNSSQSLVFTANSNGKGYLNLNTSVTPGQYYFRISANPTQDTYYFPYAFRLSYPFTTGLQETTASNISSINFPNPFSTTTTIRFHIDKQSNVKIHVLDMTGKQLEVLYDKVVEPGDHEIIFDGETLAAGLYMYSIETDFGITFSKIMKVN